jgi:hypothetical protein
VTGHVAGSEAFTDAISACDVALNLRWPTAREISGPWLRCLAAGKATIVVDLAHLADVPTLDPRTWKPNITVRHDTAVTEPCAVAIDILDEEHSLRLAMRRLGADATLREALGNAARAHWHSAHSIDAMVADYRTIIADALARPVPAVRLPAHLLEDGRGTLDRLLAPFGLPSPFGAAPRAGSQ